MLHGQVHLSEEKITPVPSPVINAKAEQSASDSVRSVTREPTLLVPELKQISKLKLLPVTYIRVKYIPHYVEI